MGWEEVIALAVQYGWPFAVSVFTKWSAGKPPTQADVDELNALANVSAKQQMTAQLQSAGIPLTDSKAVALLALVS